jgi:hypothetical protein
LVLPRRTRHIASILTLFLAFASCASLPKERPEDAAQADNRASAAPPESAPASEPPRTNREQHTRYQEPDIWGTVPDWLMVAITLGGVVAAFLNLKKLTDQITHAETAANAAKDNADTAARALIISSRPYLVAADWRVENLEVNHRAMIWYQVKNMGQIPARILSVDSGFISNKSEKWGQEPPMKPSFSAGAIVPRDAVMQRSLLVDEYLSSQQIHEMHTGELQWRVYIRVWYHGGFHKTPNRYQTCMKWDRDQQILVVCPEAGYEYAD